MIERRQAVAGLLLLVSVFLLVTILRLRSRAPFTFAPDESDAKEERTETVMPPTEPRTVHAVRLEPNVRLESITWQCTPDAASGTACRPWTITRPLLPDELPTTHTVRALVPEYRLGDVTYVFIESRSAPE